MDGDIESPSMPSWRARLPCDPFRDMRGITKAVVNPQLLPARQVSREWIS
jgi:hypothetical protein